MTRAPGKQTRRPGLLDLREKGPRAWSQVQREKIPGTQTLGSEGEEDWVSTAVGFCLIVCYFKSSHFIEWFQRRVERLGEQ